VTTSGCFGDATGTTVEVVPVGAAMTGLHVVGNHIENAAGDRVIIHGVNRSGTEYQCIHSGGFFDGDFSLASVAPIAGWKANAVRLPLNEACWLEINGAPHEFSGAAYKQSISAYVALLHQFHIIPILDLHWVGPGTAAADRQQPMPDADHAPAFWADVAATFAADDGVILELYNEPFPDSNSESDAAWQCWRDGCTADLAVATGRPASTYQAAGLQSLVDAVRGAGANNLILLGGVQYSNALSQWRAHVPADPAGNIAAAWHVYNFNSCANAACWDGAPAALAAAVPIVATEIGENDCSGAFMTPFLDWLDGHGFGYLAWSWNAYGACSQAQPFSLVTDFYGGRPSSDYARAFHDHLAAF
jgi:endoglucanase